MPIKFLFKNLGIRQIILKNTFWLTATEVISRLLKFILIINIVRVLGANEYGKFAFALSFISVFVVFSNFGIPAITTRELSREKENESEYPAVFSLQMILSLGVFFLIVIGSFFIIHDFIIQKIIIILAIYAISINFSEIIYAFFRARQAMEYEALARIIQSILLTGIGLFVIFNFASIENLSLSYLFIGLFFLIILLLFFHFKIRLLKFSFQKSIWIKFIYMSWPLGLGEVLGVIFVSVGLIIMGYFHLVTEVGLYDAAGKIINILIIPSLIIAQSFYPALSKSFKESKKDLQKTWDYQMELMIFILVPLMVGAMILAPKIIDFIYGSGFILSTVVFRILIPIIGFTYFINIFYQILVIANKQKKILLITFFISIINVILNLILIPRFNLYGAALSSFVALMLYFLLLFIFTLKINIIKPFRSKILLDFVIYIFASILMYFSLSYLEIYNFNIFILVLVGSLVYLATVFLCKKITRFIFVY